jgi:hypothetical protein
VAHFLDDVRSDFSVLHRIDEVERVPGPRFFAYCLRLPLYNGAVAARQREQRVRHGESGTRGPVSLAQWAQEHAGAVQDAYDELNEGR